ncbi:glycoside hydrolase family 43 protein [Algoriphagus sp. H41]|uniref:Glycoside hydrolase family 43 protein n=1 Tax=Algoriphagus oliviformis TaxID=2811231 RepID=A0ABS3C7N9_9BACT|nr:glycoside hydrolase family 43 protein [Algoriphagus oliviformis]MBN7812579.1 glycoside hydrolase family 43 protein [Algoriphagus oliviformis]
MICQSLFSLFFLLHVLFHPTPKQDIIRLADPTIFYHDSVYYLYGTDGSDSNHGFEVYVSSDLEDWKKSEKNGGFALKKGEAFGSKGFWAPQVFKFEGKFYMAYTADEQIAIAVSDSPLGPFTHAGKSHLPASGKEIDPYVFIDSDGKKYLYHVRLTEGNRLYVAELKDDFSGIREETLRYCFHAEEPWENTAKVAWTVSEGPAIIRHQGLYYFIYSANDFRNPDYAVGYAYAKSPLGPWTKSESNPIFTRQDAQINGTGHGDYFVDQDGKLRYVLHTHASDSEVAPRKTALIELEFVPSGNGQDALRVKAGSFRFLEK